MKTECHATEFNKSACNRVSEMRGFCLCVSIPVELGPKELAHTRFDTYPEAVAVAKVVGGKVLSEKAGFSLADCARFMVVV